MASVFRRVKRQPLPEGARVVERKGGRVAEWLDANGKRRTAPLSKDGSGIRVESATYTVQYYDEHGRPQRVASRCRDFDAAMQLGRQLEKRAMQRREGLLDPAQERFAKAARQPIAEHAAAHVDHLRAAGNTAKHVQTVERHLLAILSAAHIERLPELKSAAVLSAVAMLRNPVPVEGEKKQKKPASLATCNSHIRSMKGFSRWLWKQRLTPEDALLDLGLHNAATDRRHVRREMSADEVRWLLDVTEQRTLPEHGADGPTRAMCYRVAAATGFRASELRSLSIDSFDLDADPPTCTVEAGYSKRRKRDVQPLPPALIEPLRAWLATCEPGKPVFDLIARDTARMLRSDLAAARKAWLAAAGKEPKPVREQMQASDFLLYSDRHGHVADFHSLRVLFISRVVAGGASVKEAQTLARHSTPLLTMNVYSRASLLDVAGAVSGLGDLLTQQPSRPEPQQMRATGTEGRAEPPAPPAPRSDHYSDHCQQAQGGSEWHSGADVRPPECPEPSAAREPESATIPGVFRASAAGERKRRRWESNPRWRICNQTPSPEKPSETGLSREVTTTATTVGPADPDLAAVVEAWSSLSAAVRAGIIAMVEASRR
jgi:integrase